MTIEPIDTREPQPIEDVADFVFSVMRVGMLLADLVSDLLGGLPEDAYPGEDPSEVIFEMLAGTICPVALEHGREGVQAATDLIEASASRVLGDLKLTLELARVRGRTPQSG